MKIYLLALLLALPNVCFAHQDPPKHIRVSVQWIEVPHSLLTELTSGEKKSGSEIHQAVLASVKEGKAKILETGIVMGRSGMRSSIESIREEIYPTEYNPPGSDAPPSPPVVPRTRGITSFEPRNVGVMIEVEPTLGSDDSIIDLRFNAEIVAPGRLVTWMEHKDRWGDASVRMPFYEKWTVTTALILANGKFDLASVISPKATQPAPFVLSKILIFVRADVMP
jgi:hypothetical protein